MNGDVAVCHLVLDILDDVSKCCIQCCRIFTIIILCLTGKVFHVVGITENTYCIQKGVFLVHNCICFSLCCPEVPTAIVIIAAAICLVLSVPVITAKPACTECWITIRHKDHIGGIRVIIVNTLCSSQCFFPVGTTISSNFTNPAFYSICIIILVCMSCT